MSGQTEQAAAKVLAELGTVVSLPVPRISVRSDEAGGLIVTLRPGVTFGEIVSTLSLWAPGAAWQLPPLPDADGSVRLVFALPRPDLPGTP